MWGPKSWTLATPLIEVVKFSAYSKYNVEAAFPWLAVGLAGIQQSTDWTMNC